MNNKKNTQLNRLKDRDMLQMSFLISVCLVYQYVKLTFQDMNQRLSTYQ